MGPGQVDWFAVGPLLGLAGGALAALVVELVLPAGLRSPAARGAGFTGLALGAVGLWRLWSEAVGGAEPVVAFGGAWVVDPWTLFMGGLILLSATFALVIGGGPAAERELPGFVAQLLWATMGMLVLAGAGNLLGLFLGLELLSLSLYILVALGAPARDRAAPAESALKFLVLGSIGAGMLLMGAAFLYGATGQMDYRGIRTALAAGGGLSETAGVLALAGLALILVGLGYKMALAPFHLWSPDAYQHGPTSVTAFMAVGSKVATLGALVRLLAQAVPPGQADLYLAPLLLLALASMVLGNVAAIGQTNLKRLLAYSGIAHAGYVLAALPGLTQYGITVAAFYLTVYAFMNLGAFGVIGWLELRGEAGASLDTYEGLFQRQPALALAMAVFFLALVGVAPTAGFLAKLYLLNAAAGSGTALAWLLLGGIVVTSAVAGYVYLKVVRAMFLGGVPAGAPAAPAGQGGHLWALSSALALAAGLTLQLGVWPQPLFGYLDELASMLLAR